MRILFGADENALGVRDLVQAAVEHHGDAFIDLSAGDPAHPDYPDVAWRVAGALAAGEGERGVLVCGTGIGMSITANKVPGIRAALAHDPYSAERAIRSNNAQILTMGALVIGPTLMTTIVETWLAATWDPSTRSGPKVARIEELEGTTRG
jgi:RpiB/LacA/LacB family sugar-phosphate isomerase